MRCQVDFCSTRIDVMATRRGECANGLRPSTILMSSFALFPRTSRLSPALKPSRPGVTTENLPQALSCPLASLRREGFAGNFSLPGNHFVAARDQAPCSKRRPSRRTSMFINSRNVFLAAIAVSVLAGVRRYLQGNATRASRTSTSTDNAAAPAIRIAGKAEAATSPATARSAATMISRQAVARPGSPRGGSCASNLASGLGNDLVGICQPCRSVRLPVGGVRTRRLSLPAHHVAGAIFFAGSCAALAC